MAQEIEVKFLNINHSDIRAKLKELAGSGYDYCRKGGGEDNAQKWRFLARFSADYERR